MKHLNLKLSNAESGQPLRLDTSRVCCAEPQDSYRPFNPAVGRLRQLFLPFRRRQVLHVNRRLSVSESPGFFAARLHDPCICSCFFLRLRFLRGRCALDLPHQSIVANGSGPPRPTNVDYSESAPDLQSPEPAHLPRKPPNRPAGRVRISAKERGGSRTAPARRGSAAECFVTRRRRPCRGHRSRRRCRARPRMLQAWAWVWARLAARLRPRQPSEPLWTPSLWQDGANGHAA